MIILLFTLKDSYLHLQSAELLRNRKRTRFVLLSLELVVFIVINTVYLHILYLLFSPIHGVSLLEKKNHQLFHKNNKDDNIHK